MTVKVGIAGLGAIGSAVANALTSDSGIEGYHLECLSELNSVDNYHVDNVDFETLMNRCDLVVECLPADIVPELVEKAFDTRTDVILISSAALLIYPQIVDMHQAAQSKIYLPSGALSGIDGVRAMKEMGITEAKIASTKPPLGFGGAPYIQQNDIDLSAIEQKTLLFEGNALEAAKGFPANINVAATLSIAGIGGEKTRVEIWADPTTKNNKHEITVKSEFSTLTSTIENMPDPKNPKSSVLAAQSIVATLKNMHSAVVLT